MRFTPVAAAAALVAFVSPGFVAAEPPSLRDQLVAGQQVKVEGRTSDGVFHAQSVTLRDTVNTVKVEGAVVLVADAGRRLQVLDFPISVDSSTRLYRGTQPAGSRSMVARGSWIEAKGTWQGGVLRAARIRLKAAAEPTEEIEGAIQSADPAASALMVLDRRILLQPGAVVFDERTGQAPAGPSGRLRRDDDDAEGRAPIAFGNVVVGGRIEAGFLEEENFEPAVRGTERMVLSRLQLLGASQITDTIEAYAKVTMTRSAPTGGVAHGEARLSEGYVIIHQLGGAPVDVQIGRQRFRDSREWFFDDYLDAARVHVTLPAVKVEAAVSRGISPGAERVRERRDELQFLMSAATRLFGTKVAAHTLARRDATRNERVVWIGGSMEGGAGGNWRYWGNVVTRRGSSATSRLTGWASDGGVKHTWNRRWSPVLTLGYAFGSGDRTRGDGLDTRFRQTDLEDNQAYFGGLRRIAIYGELFDPELSNLHVLTAGVGVRPWRGFGLDAIYHRFAQATPTASLPSGNLNGELNGLRRLLGDELNVVMTLRATRSVDLDLAVGAFLPGAAFGPTTAPAFFWRPQIRFYF